MSGDVATQTISKMTQQRANAQVRRQQVLEMRLGGGSFRAIADRLQVALGTIHRDYQMAMSALVDKETADQARSMQTERYQRLLLSYWPRAIGYTDEQMVKQAPDMDAANLCLKIIHHIRAMNGLDAPTKTELSGKDGGPIPHKHGGKVEVDANLVIEEEIFKGAVIALAEAGLVRVVNLPEDPEVEPIHPPHPDG